MAIMTLIRSTCMGIPSDVVMRRICHSMHRQTRICERSARGWACMLLAGYLRPATGIYTALVYFQVEVSRSTIPDILRTNITVYVR